MDTADPADRRVFTLSSTAWNTLQQRLNEPPAPNAALIELLSRPSALED